MGNWLTGYIWKFFPNKWTYFLYFDFYSVSNMHIFLTKLNKIAVSQMKKIFLPHSFIQPLFKSWEVLEGHPSLSVMSRAQIKQVTRCKNVINRNNEQTNKTNKTEECKRHDNHTGHAVTVTFKWWVVGGQSLYFIFSRLK